MVFGWNETAILLLCIRTTHFTQRSARSFKVTHRRFSWRWNKSERVCHQVADGRPVELWNWTKQKQKMFWNSAKLCQNQNIKKKLFDFETSPMRNLLHFVLWLFIVTSDAQTGTRWLSQSLALYRRSSISLGAHRTLRCNVVVFYECHAVCIQFSQQNKWKKEKTFRWNTVPVEWCRWCSEIL